ncbi:MAG: HNH endonuclease [Ruminococcus sp.]|nr:HNH endonuclease [Ruminococcus sp.]
MKAKTREYMRYDIGEIRFLPMGKNIFGTYDEVSEFILSTLPKRGGLYYFKKQRMRCNSNILVLFQYSGQLIGCGVLLSTVDEPTKLGTEQYYGYYQFASETLRLFDAPIIGSEYSTIDSSFTRFGQGMKKVPIDCFTSIVKLIENRTAISSEIFSILPEELDKEQFQTLVEGAKKRITINAYERNPKAKAICISHYRVKNKGRIKCEICDFDFGTVYGEAFSDKIVVHHIKEISSIGKDYEVDPIKDLLPVCPNCHLIAHSKTPAYTPDEIRSMLGK